MARVLVIDDDAGIRTTVRKFLAAEGHDILEADDGNAALKILGTHPMDLVITDVYMPGMDGVEFTIRMRQLPTRPAIIAISGGGYMGAADVLEVERHLGARHTLSKPFTRDELVNAVRDALTPREP